jgi:hypothetical protein
MPEDDLLGRILEPIADLPTYAYQRVQALLRQQAELEGWPPPLVLGKRQANLPITHIVGG